MIIFSERVNGMYRDIRGAIKEKNKEVVREIAKAQVAGGADVLDINIGPVKGDPVENFVWLAETVHEVTDLPLSLDSAKAKVLAEAIPRVKEALPDTHLVLNSCTAAPDYMDKLIPVAAQHGCSIIGLTMDQDGVPGNVEKRIECGATFLMTAMEAGIDIDNIYLDPITLPVNAAFKQQEFVVEAIRQLAIVNDPPPHFIISRAPPILSIVSILSMSSPRPLPLCVPPRPLWLSCSRSHLRNLPHLRTRIPPASPNFLPVISMASVTPMHLPTTGVDAFPAQRVFSHS